jgi:CRP-like cAMP-binding protein
MSELCHVGSLINRPAHTVLITEGGHGDAFFLIVHGTVDVSVKGVSVSKSGPGQFFGEMSIIKGVPCTVCVDGAPLA